jgi:hypothetical protein
MTLMKENGEEGVRRRGGSEEEEEEEEEEDRQVERLKGRKE